MKSNEKQIRLRIGGMTCVHCQSKIEKVLRRTDGILSVSVSFTTGIADITWDTRKLSLSTQLRTAPLRRQRFKSSPAPCPRVDTPALLYRQAHLSNGSSMHQRAASTAATIE